MAIQLQPLTVEQLPLLQKHIKSLQNGDCNLSIASLISRAKEYKILYALEGEDLVINWQPYEECPPSYVLPWKSPRIGDLLLKIEGDCHCVKEPLLIFGRFTDITEYVQRQQRYRNFMTVSSNAWWDYLYGRDRLVSLEGRNLNGKRNFNKRFHKAYPDAAFEILTPQNIGLAKEFLEKWYAERGELDASLAAEREAILLAFDHYEEFELFGGLLTDGHGTVFGFSYGSQVFDDIFAVHIEKADRNIVGAYPALAVSLAKSLPEQYTILNREEDLGIQGLRKAKADWFPCGVVRKTVLKLLPCSMMQ